MARDVVLLLPPDFADYAWEVEAKGWFDQAIAQVDGQRYRITFYDPVRLSQDIAAELRKGRYFHEPNLVVVPGVTREQMKAALDALASAGVHRSFAAEPDQPRNVRHEVNVFVGLGTLPPSTADESVIAAHERALGAIQAPLTSSEAAALLSCFGPDDCFGLAWSLLHLIETAPRLPLIEPPGETENPWLHALWARARQPDSR